MKNIHNFAVIMAGGSGTRFWPFSTVNKSKQLLHLTTHGTQIQQTVSRILPLISDQNIFIVTNEFLQEELRRQVAEVSDIPDGNIIVEPMRRNTLPCIGLASLYIKDKDPEPSSTMVIFPSDHFIRYEERFRQILSHAHKVVSQENDCLVTFGIKPSRPETGYGYISLKNKLYSIDDSDVFKVDQFTEKPNKQAAIEFVESGNYLWNGGIFMLQTATLLDMIEKFVPDIFGELSKIEHAIGTPDEQKVIQKSYSRMRNISVDYAIVEKADNVLVIPADIGWSDIGSWAAMNEVWQKDADGNVCQGKHVGIDTNDCVIYGDKLIATIGLNELVIVDTERALLVCPKSRAQDVKKIVEKLKEKG